MPARRGRKRLSAPVSVKVPSPLAAQLRERATREGVTLSALLRRVLVQTATTK